VAKKEGRVAKKEGGVAKKWETVVKKNTSYVNVYFSAETAPGLFCCKSLYSESCSDAYKAIMNP
jgi:hypothetical protein